ncbi:MAG: hypothetical protein SGI77_20575 [Pirellulaceae bacterium]|nr:hypothetical protein [Pirellulaceae bacterium]
MLTFRTEYSIHLRYLKGLALFVRAEQLPFPPFIGLDVLDDVLGEFKIEHVAWHTGSGMFLCQATVDRKSLSLAVVKRTLKKVGWSEVHEAREVG